MSERAVSGVPAQIPSLGVLVAYGSIAVPLCLAEIPIVVYLPAFYAKELSLSAGLVGVVFLLARLWDGLSDITVGWLSDRSTSSLGRRKPWVIAGAPFLVLSSWYLCNPPRDPSLAYLAIWAALFYTAFTAVKIPHLSWGTELATEYVQRSRVTSVREAFTMLGSLAFVTGPLILLKDDSDLRGILFLVSMTTLITVPPAAIALWAFVRDPQVTSIGESHLLQKMASLANDRVLRRFLLGRLIFATEEGVCNSLLILSFGAGLQLADKFFWLIFILYVATLCTLPGTLSLARRVEKHRLLASGIAIQAIVYGIVVSLPHINFLSAAVLWAVLGAANTAMLSLPTSILADIIDCGEVSTGERLSGAYVAIDNLTYKIGMALGVGIGFGLLELVHFVPGAAVHDSGDVLNIKLIGFGLPCLLSSLAVIPYFTHPITRAVQKGLREQIESTRKAPEPVERDTKAWAMAD